MSVESITVQAMILSLLCPPRRSNQPGLGQNGSGLPAGPRDSRRIDGLVEGKHLRQYEPRMFVFSWIWYKLRDLIKTSFDRKQIGSKSDVSPHLQKSFDFSAAQWGKIFRQAPQWTASTASVLPADFSGIVDRALVILSEETAAWRRAANSLWRESHELP